MSPCFNSCLRLLREGVEDQAFPSAAWAIGQGRQVFCSGVVGNRTLHPAAEPADRDTLYDLASLSKLISTTMVALRLIEEGRLLLTDPLSCYFTAEELDGAPEGRAEVTVFSLMTHTSGLTPHIALWNQLPEPEDHAVAHAILTSAPFCRPGEQVYYSCMGYILLQKILERLTGQSLADLARLYVFGPLGMRRTGYTPREDNVATTEFSPLRHMYIKGEVHDENAHFLGGVSGNAGVFAPLDDMINFAIMCATHGNLPGIAFGTGEGPFLSRRTFDLAVQDYTPGLAESRGLGFQLKPPLPRLSAMGDLMAEGSYGHTGFTGTSLYVDSQTGVWGVLLTNAVHFGRDKTAFFRYRRLFYNAMMAGFGLTEANETVIG